MLLLQIAVMVISGWFPIALLQKVGLSTAKMESGGLCAIVDGEQQTLKWFAGS